VSHIHCGRLDQAVAAAADDASRSQAKEPVVLLSPACASYDQFANFEKRGEAFCTIVMGLDGAKSLKPEQGQAA
jgi:UDP-N-acetylmuramoylalanine--D-glutamate ligase